MNWILYISYSKCDNCLILPELYLTDSFSNDITGFCLFFFWFYFNIGVSLLHLYIILYYFLCLKFEDRSISYQYVKFLLIANCTLYSKKVNTNIFQHFHKYLININMCYTLLNLFIENTIIIIVFFTALVIAFHSISILSASHCIYRYRSVVVGMR